MIHTLIAAALGLLLCSITYAAPTASAWPYAPFYTEGRQMKDSRNETVLYAGVNWPGHADAMIPEGLQYQSIATIVSKIKSLNMNSIRLTYAIQMIDDIYNGGDVAIDKSLSQALGSSNGSAILAKILKNNPQFTAKTTRLQVFDAVAAECAKQQIYVHLDNHVSKAMWCCGQGDGNSWPGDTYFNENNWRRGLAYMATYAKNWTAFTSISLRNEFRQTTLNNNAKNDYSWGSWFTHVVPAMKAINDANSAPLIFLSGLDYDTKMGSVSAGVDLGNGKKFLLSDYSYKNKIVFELHNYSNDAKDCNSLKSSMYSGGYNAMDTKSGVKNIAPVVMTEFGFAQDKSTANGVYAQCHKENLLNQPGGPGGWHQWVIAGTYYIRSGTQDYDEAWGLFNHNWSGWRNSDAASYTADFAAKTLKGLK